MVPWPWCGLVNPTEWNTLKTHTKKSYPQKAPPVHDPGMSSPSPWQTEGEFSSPPTSISLTLSFRFLFSSFWERPCKTCRHRTGACRHRSNGLRPSSPFTAFVELYFSSSSSVFPASEMIGSWEMLLWSYFWLPSFQPWCLPAHPQPLTAVRRGFQLLGFLLTYCNTSSLRAQLHLEAREKWKKSYTYWIKSPLFGESDFSPFLQES